MGQGCSPLWSDGNGYVVETSWHGDCDRVEIYCGERSNEGCEVGPVHQEVAGEDLAEALVELGLNESNKG